MSDVVGHGGREVLAAAYDRRVASRRGGSPPGSRPSVRLEYL
ncbi:hypothetical protein [Streptomyces chrestomyceticus]|nr:hypothetical protein [Streptomyces chrestomyceticus]